MAGGKWVMRLIYGTTNKAKIDFMKRRVEHLGIEILSLNDVGTPKLHIEENGNSPLDNARIKALAYYDVLKKPVFSCDTGLYIDGLDDKRQPGINVRGQGDYMSDEEALRYYSALAAELGGSMTARYQNAIVLVLDEKTVYEHMGEDIASEPFLMVSKPHKNGVVAKGFPLDCLSVHIESGKYYYDIDGYIDKYLNVHDGFAAFFQSVPADHLSKFI
jgi:8-oxo-dGTP diphosphatase